jgi:hypothetical protein
MAKISFHSPEKGTECDRLEEAAQKLVLFSHKHQREKEEGQTNNKFVHLLGFFQSGLLFIH